MQSSLNSDNCGNNSANTTQTDSLNNINLPIIVDRPMDQQNGINIGQDEMKEEDFNDMFADANINLQHHFSSISNSVNTTTFNSHVQYNIEPTPNTARAD